MEEQNSFAAASANISDCDSDLSGSTILPTQDSTIESPIELQRTPSTPAMSLNRIVPEVGKSMADMTDDEFVTIDFEARRRQMTLNILAKTRDLQSIQSDHQSESSPKSLKGKVKSKGRNEEEEAGSSPISSDVPVSKPESSLRITQGASSSMPSLRMGSTRLSPQASRPSLQKSLSELCGSTPSSSAQITFKKLHRPVTSSGSNIQSVQPSVAATARNRAVTDPIPEPLAREPVSAPPTVPGVPPLMSAEMRALVDPISLPIPSPINLSQPRFRVEVNERPEDFAEHPAFRDEGDITIRDHHHGKASTLIGEISKLSIVGQTSQAKEGTDTLDKYSEKNRQERINKVLEDMTASLKNGGEPVPPDTPIIPSHPIPVQGDACIEHAVSKSRKTFRDIKMIDVKRDVGVEGPEDMVLAGSARKQSWATGVQTAAPNAIKDPEHRGYSAHLGHKDIDDFLPLSSRFRKKLEDSRALVNASQHGMVDGRIYNVNRSRISTMDETLEVMRRMPGGDYAGRTAVVKSATNCVDGPTDVDGLIKMTATHERRKSVMMERSKSFAYLHPTADMGKENDRVSSMGSDKAKIETPEEQVGESSQADASENDLATK
ncbi:hypothetical protein K440DRAFT_638974 [Wilcoxina mikolae CBS 423.85]|nr:hypothetical protein K440DRAFT_638974 [Wilcoxina mikolae CBS 423.85]